eukprot:4181392-Pyramimonas_sp.AAC.1
MAVCDGEMVDRRVERQGPAKHFAMSARGGSFIVNARNGCYPEGEFMDEVKKGSGAAALAAMLRGPSGDGLLRFCEGAAGDY